MKKLKRLFLSKSVGFRKGLSYASVAGVGIMAYEGSAQAQTIIQDNFTSGSHYGTAIDQQGTNSTGLAPTTDTAVPGQLWQHINGAFYDSTEYSNSGSSSNYFFAQNNAQFHNDASAGLSLGTSNSGSLTLSSNVGYNLTYNSGAPAGANAFALLGFTSTLNTASNYGPTGTTNFTGLKVLADGSLQEVVNGSNVGTAEAYGGTFSSYLTGPGTLSKLTYTIDTSTGAISNVSFGNSTTAYSFAAASSFSNAYTANLDIGGQAANSGDTVAFTDLTLSAAGSSGSAVPEPSTYGMLAGGGLMLAAYLRRRSRLSS
jgi:hypothetical protein